MGGQVPSYTYTPGRNGGQALRRPPDVQKVSQGLSDGVALGGREGVTWRYVATYSSRAPLRKRIFSAGGKSFGGSIAVP